MNFKSKVVFTALALVASSAALAQAKATEPSYTLTFNAGAVNDYRFRGITQTNYGAAGQVGVDFAHKSGFYVGSWASNVNWVKQVNGASKGDFEVDVYGGYKTELAGLAFDVGYITYQYPGNDSGEPGSQLGAGSYSNASTREAYVGVTYKMLTVKYNQSIGDFLGNLNSNASRYWDASATFDVGYGLTLTPHVGRQMVANTLNSTVADYNDYAVTLAKDFGNGFVVSAAMVATNADQTFYVNQGGAIGDGKYIAKTGAVVGLKYSF